jgi:hypothetical protein
VPGWLPASFALLAKIEYNRIVLSAGMVCRGWFSV